MNRFGAALAVARAARRERRNLMWRFSPLKAGAWLLLFQLGAAGAVLYNFARRDFALPLPSALALVVAQSAVWGVSSAFVQERDRLYQNRVAELVHISPAPGYSVPLGNLLSDLPSRAWTSLIWAGMFSAPLASGWRRLPILWLASLVFSTATQLAATRLLVAAVRRQPRLLAWMWALTLAGMAILSALFAYALYRPELLQAFTARLLPLAPLLAALLALAGGGAGLAVMLRPERLGLLYRESWLRFAESARTVNRRSASRWPALAGGAAGSAQAKEWLLLMRNPLTWVRLGALSVLLVVLALLRPWLSALSFGVRRAASEAVPFGAVLFILGEVVAASLPSEREKLALLAVAGSSAARLLLGKLLAFLPIVLVSSGCYALSAWLFGFEEEVWHLFWEGAACGFGMVALLLGAGALDAPRNPPGLQAVEAYQQMLEQVPTGFFSQAGVFTAAAFGAARAWGAPLLQSLAWFLPLSVLCTGWIRLDRFFRRGRVR